MTSASEKFSVVVPVFNCADSIKPLTARLGLVLDEIGGDYEVILVDDGSTDRSWQEILSLVQKDSRYRGIKLSRNFGQHNAITTGLQKCDGSWTVIMDCDLQDRPENIPEMLLIAKKGFDSVVAKSKNTSKFPVSRWPAVLFYKLFSYLSGYNLEYGDRNFRLISQKVRQAVLAMPEQTRLLSALHAWVGFSSVRVHVETDSRHLGKSSYSFFDLVKLAIENLLQFSDKPLRLSIITGAVMSISAVGFGCYVVVRALLGQITIEGWASTIVSIYFVGGLLLTNIGILGVYLSKVFQEVKSRPFTIIEFDTLDGVQKWRQ